MTRRRFRSYLLLHLVLLVAPFDAWAWSVDQTTVNGRSNPMGISRDDISFSWALVAEGRGVVQHAFEIRVSRELDGAEVWNSGKVDSDRQTDITLPASVNLNAATRYSWQVRVWDGSGKVSDWSAPAWFETGLLSETDWAGAQWISAPPPMTDAVKPRATPLPLLRGVWSLGKKIRSARLHATALGLYQVSINGRRVGDQYLAPGWTDYHKRIQSQTYDVTALLQEGKNAVGVALGDGWYRGKVGIGWSGVYGGQLAFVAKLLVVYEDGSTGSFATDESWRTADGPFVRADLQDGETYDARLEQKGWDRAEFDASSWTPVVIVKTGDTGKRVPQPDEPIRAKTVLRALGRTSLTPGAFIYDLGQNMVGVPRVKLTGKAGQTVRLRFAEELYRLGERKGQLYTDNFRSAKVTDSYTFATDGAVVYQPTFTQHGFRYIEISGVDVPPDAADVEGVVLASDLRDSGELRVSHPMLDQLVRNIRWGQRGNFLSIPTDTPARDERLGWTGDISVFAPTASRFQDTRAFLTKWMDDLRDAQKKDGNIPAIVPQPRSEFNETGVGWSDAYITVPYAVWRSTGDLRIVRRNWDAMLRFYRFVHESATRDGNLLEEGRSSWFSGDWLNLEGVDRLQEHKLIATAYFAENTRMMAEMAAALGDAETAKTCEVLVPKIRAAFCSAFRNADGSLQIGTQTVYAMALGMDLIADSQERALTAAKFVEKLAADHYHLKTGFLGTPWLLPALTRIGRDDLALRLLLNEDYPSWGFEVRMGATTMWERWNSIGPDGAFGPVDMNSFNHYAYGAVGEWMFQHLGGVELLEPGYRRFRIAPLISQDGIRHTRCELLTPRGQIACEWTVAGDALKVNVVVPVNTEAELAIPASRLDQVTEAGVPVERANGVHSATITDGKLNARLGSGRYEFTVDVKP